MSYGDGKIQRYRLADGRERFLVRIPDGRGEYRPCGTYDTLDEAERMRAAGLRARSMVPTGETLAEYGRTWLARVSPLQRNARSWRSSWDLHVAPTDLGRTLVSEIERSDVRDWMRELAGKDSARGEPLSWQSRKHALGLVRRCLAEAVEDGLLDANPAREIKLDRRPSAGDEWTYLELHEIAAVLALELPAQTRAAIEWAALTGLRQGELAALQWSDVDEDARTIRVRRSWDRAATKTGRARLVTLIPEALAAVARWRSAAPAGDLVFAGPSGMWGRGWDWGWGDRRGGRKDIPTRAGIRRRVRWHDLRHTHASHLVSGSWSVGPWSLELVRDQLGHSSIEETERYAHLTPARRQRAAQAGQSAIDRQSQERDLLEAMTRIEAQLAEIRGESDLRAVGDSNARPTAPEAEVFAGILGEIEGLLPIDCRFEADRLLASVLERRECSPEAARRLALATLAQLPSAIPALRLLAEPTTARAVDLAGQLAGAGPAARRGSA